MTTSILANRDILLQISIYCDNATLQKLALLGLWESMLSFIASSQFWAGLVVQRLTPRLTFDPTKDYRKVYAVLAHMKGSGYPNRYVKMDPSSTLDLVQMVKQAQVEWAHTREARLDEARRAIAIARANERAESSLGELRTRSN